MTELNAAEQAVVDVLLAMELETDDRAVEARAVVAAVRGPIHEEVAQRLLRHAQDAKDNDATEDAVYTFMVAANNVREWGADRQAEGSGT